VFSRLAFSANILLSGANRVAIAILSEDVTAVLAETSDNSSVLNSAHTRKPKVYIAG
jgi:hypothetical protein